MHEYKCDSKFYSYMKRSLRKTATRSTKEDKNHTLYGYHNHLIYMYIEPQTKLLSIEAEKGKERVIKKPI